MEKVSNNKGERLLSLDILRGFDLACLVLIQPIIFTWLEILHPAQGTFLSGVMGQIEHLPWEGFCFWDIIMPLFMFMSGITIPFAMSKYKTQLPEKKGEFFRRIFKRFVILWILGMFCQGNLMELDINQLKLFSNTLQSIAVGYVVVAILYVFTSLRTQIIVVAISFLSFIAVFAIWGGMDFTIDANICEEIDKRVLGHFRDGVIWSGGSWSWDPTYHYTWILSSFNFIVTVFLGCMTGYLLKNKQTSQMRKFWTLIVSGIVLIVAAFAISPVIPIIKHIWSSSMTLFAGGICVLLMAIFYYFIDIKGWRKGLSWLKYYGMNSLAAYVLVHISFNSIIDAFFIGFKQWMGDFYPVLQVTCEGIIIYLIVRWMYKKNIFIKA